MPLKTLVTNLLIYLIFVFLSCSSPAKKSESTDRKSTLYINLGIYTPGTKLAFGDPLQASKIIADSYTD